MREEVINNLIAWLHTYSNYLNPWQRTFVNGLRHCKRLTPKQIAKLEQTIRQVKIKLAYPPLLADVLLQEAIRGEDEEG